MVAVLRREEVSVNVGQLEQDVFQCTNCTFTDWLDFLCLG